MCHEVKKSAPAAWSGSYIFLFDQNVVFLGFNQLVRKAAFSWVVRQFSTIFENVISCHITVLESNCFQKSLLRQKSAPAAWSESYIFLFDQNVVFLGFHQLVRKTAFSWVVRQFFTIFENVMSCHIIDFEPNFAPRSAFHVKKVVRPLGQILPFFLTKDVFFLASTSLQGKLNFLGSRHNFLLFLKLH